jgi:hypothetical protein
LDGIKLVKGWANHKGISKILSGVRTGKPLPEAAEAWVEAFVDAPHLTNPGALKHRRDWAELRQNETDGLGGVEGRVYRRRCCRWASTSCRAVFGQPLP